MGGGDGVDNDCWLTDGDTMLWRWDCEDEEELEVRAADNETLGESNLRPLDGERAENR